MKTPEEILEFEDTSYDVLIDSSYAVNIGAIMELNGNGAIFTEHHELTTHPRRMCFKTVFDLKKYKHNNDTIKSLVKIGTVGKFGICNNPEVSIIDSNFVIITVQLKNYNESFYDISLDNKIIKETINKLFALGADKKESKIDKNKVLIWIPHALDFFDKVRIIVLCAGISKYGIMFNSYYFDGGSISLKFEI